MAAGSLRTRIMNVARGPNAERTLWGVSFAESSFFPLPPDLLLGPMAALEPGKWTRFAIGCTIASVLGGLLGYAIGMFLMAAIGDAIIGAFGLGEQLEALKALLKTEQGLWLQAQIIFIKGLLPIPYKLLTIAAGATGFNLALFIVMSLVTRGLRFFAVAWIFQRFGPQVAPIIERRMGLALLVVGVAIVAVIVALPHLH